MELRKCLECGRDIYGRPEKKFCCDDCRMRFHYYLATKKSRCKKRILANINRNYEILDSLVENQVKSIDLIEISQMGFVQGCVTGAHKSTQKEQMMFCCYDIEYKQSPNRLTNIRRLGKLSDKG